MQNCRDYKCADFFSTDHRLVIATLRLQIRSQRLSRCYTPTFTHDRLKYLQCAAEFAVAVSDWFEALDTLESCNPPLKVKLFRLLYTAFRTAHDLGVDMHERSHWSVSSNVSLPGLLGAVASSGLLLIGLGIS